MMKIKRALVLLTFSALGLTVGFQYHQQHKLVHRLNQTTSELAQSKAELKETKTLLFQAEEKIGFIALHRTRVQVTAYTKQPTSDRFANGHSLYRAYAVKGRSLPPASDAIMNVALSLSAQRKLGARMGDTLVILDRRRKAHLARFVDITSQNESRAVIDVFFADQRNARLWGRRTLYAVNLSARNSPFRRN